MAIVVSLAPYLPPLCLAPVPRTLDRTVGH